MAKRIKLTAPECCPVMALVVTRCNGSDRRVGITREMMLSFKTGRTRYELMLHFPKAKRGDKSEHASATYSPVNFCPFCGAEQEARSE